MQLKVLARLRPPNDSNSTGLAHVDHRVLYIKDPLRGHSNEFVFDKVFDGEATQETVFSEVGTPLVEHAMQGYNACCLAYGHTGSGKTYSMCGRDVMAGPAQDASEAGIIPRVCELIAKTAQQTNRKSDNLESHGNNNLVRIKLFVSFTEIHMENIRDLGAAAQAYIRLQQHHHTLASSSSANSNSSAKHSGSTGDSSTSGGITGAGSGNANGGGGGGVGINSPRHSDGPPPPGLGLPTFATSDGSHPAATTRPAVPPLREPSDYMRGSLEVLEDTSGVTFVKDLTLVEVNTADDMLALLRAGYTARATCCPMDVSSRAHTIFTISVVTYRGNQQPVTGRLNLIDLAGSEKQSKAGPEAQRLREASVVGKSLTALGKVIAALSQPHAPPSSANLLGPPIPSSNSSSPSSSPIPPIHIPYRDSKLTRILKSAFTGNCLTVLIACVHPVINEVDECLATLQFANRTMMPVNAPSAPHVKVGGGAGGSGRSSGARVGQEGASAGAVEDLTAQISQLKDELEVTHAHYQKLLETLAGPSWRLDPGPVERAPGADDYNPVGLGAFAAALSNFGKAALASNGSGPSGGSGGGGGTNHPVSGGGGAGAAGGAGEGRRTSNMGEGHRATKTGGDAVRPSMAGVPMGSPGGSGVVGSGGGAMGRVTTLSSPQTTLGMNVSARVTLLEAQIRKLESQLSQARIAAQQYEERLTARKEEMDLARERMAGKEHAQFAEIKKLRAQVAELTKALDAERAESASKLDEARRRSDDESHRLMKDIEALRHQLAQVTGSVGNLVQRHSAAITAEKKQREAVKRQATHMLQQQFARGTEEHKAQLENLKQQSRYFLTRRTQELQELKDQLDNNKAAAAAEKDALMSELDYLASYAERVTELIRRMESGVLTVTERSGGIKAFRLPQRDRPPRLDSARLAILKERSAELYERLVALSAAAAIGSSGNLSTANSSRAGTPPTLPPPQPQQQHSPAPMVPGASSPAAPSTTSGATFGGWMGVGAPQSGSPGRLSTPGMPPTGPSTSSAGGGGGLLGTAVDLDALRAQVEAELKAQVAAQLVGDLRSEKTVEYIRQLESEVARYRSELQAEKRRSSEMTVALRSVQRQQQRSDSPINKAIATHSPAGTIKLGPTWGMGHTGTPRSGMSGRPATAGLIPSLGDTSAGVVSGAAQRRRPMTSISSLTGSFRENGLSVP